MRPAGFRYTLPTSLATLLTFGSLAVGGSRAGAQEAPPYPPPPAYAQPPPVYQQAPVYQPAPVYTQAPPTLPPPQLHYEERPRWGLMAAGLSVFGGVYLLNASIGYAAGEGYLAIPVVGPLVEIGKLHNQNNVYCTYPAGAQYADYSCGREENAGDRLLYVFFVFDALVQTAGVIMAIAGIASRTKVVVYDRVSIVPVATPTSAGLAAVGHF